MSSPAYRSDLVRKLRLLIEQLTPLADSLKPPPIHLVGNCGDAVEEYCKECCTLIVETRNASQDFDEQDMWYVDGGYNPSRESDGPAFCCKCGRTLSYFLSPYSVSNEMNHYLAVIAEGFSDTYRLEDAYAVRALLVTASQMTNQIYLSKCIKIGEAAVVALNADTCSAEI
jgi:hypothetical protein